MKQYRIDPSNGLEFGLYTLGDHLPNPQTGERISAQQRIHEIIELAQLAEQAGLDFFSVGESHQDFFTTQAHTVVLSAIAQATEKSKSLVRQLSLVLLILSARMKTLQRLTLFQKAVLRLWLGERHV